MFSYLLKFSIHTASFVIYYPIVYCIKHDHVNRSGHSYTKKHKRNRPSFELKKIKMEDKKRSHSATYRDE